MDTTEGSKVAAPHAAVAALPDGASDAPAAPELAPAVSAPVSIAPAPNAASPGLQSALEAAPDASTPSTCAAAGATAAPVKKGRGAGKRLTDRERLEILELFETSGAGVSNAEIARRYGITRAAIQKLKLKGAEVRARYRYGSAGSRDGRKRGSHAMSVPFERELFEWVRALKARKVPVPPALVKEKAKLLVPKYALGDFQASNGWYYNFCKRFNLATGLLVEEKPSAGGAEPAHAGATGTSGANAANGSQTHALLHTQVQTPVPAYDQQMQQYQQQVAALAGLPPVPTYTHEHEHKQEKEQEKEKESKSDRILALLAQQAVLLERQTRASEQQAESLQQLLRLFTAKDASTL